MEVQQTAILSFLPLLFPLFLLLSSSSSPLDTGHGTQSPAYVCSIIKTEPLFPLSLFILRQDLTRFPRLTVNTLSRPDSLWAWIPPVSASRVAGIAAMPMTRLSWTLPFGQNPNLCHIPSIHPLHLYDLPFCRSVLDYRYLVSSYETTKLSQVLLAHIFHLWLP